MLRTALLVEQKKKKVGIEVKSFKNNKERLTQRPK